MLIAVSYDIVSAKARVKVHKLLSGFGMWKQYSVFECMVDDKSLAELKKGIRRLIDDKTDSVRIYRLCESCLANVEIIGTGVIYEEKDVYVV